MFTHVSSLPNNCVWNGREMYIILLVLQNFNVFTVIPKDFSAISLFPMSTPTTGSLSGRIKVSGNQMKVFWSQTQK